MVRAEAAYAAFRLGPGVVNLHGEAPRVRRALARAWTPEHAAVPDEDVVLDVTIVERPGPPPEAERQGDAGDGVATASDGSRLWWRGSGGWSAIAAGDRPVSLVLDGREPAWRLLGPARSAARRSLPAIGAVAVHGSLVAAEGSGILVSGWSESGKTEVALALALALGGGLASDKWVVVRDGGAWAVPGAAGIRGWVVPYLAGGLSAMSGIQRARLRSEGITRRASRALARARAIHPIADTLGAPFGALLPQVPVVRRAPGALLAGVPRTPGTGSLPLRAGVLLLGGEGPASSRPLDRDEIVRRMAVTTQHEEDLALGLGSRARYGGVPWFPEDGGSDRLREALVGVPLHAIRLPFPADPRPAAELIASLL